MPARTKVGSVTRARYEEIIAEDRKLIENDTKIQFKIGDHALEIEPMRDWGGSQPASGEELLGAARPWRCTPRTSEFRTTR
jgi:hypothetical protein